MLWVSLQCVIVAFLDLPFNQCEETNIKENQELRAEVSLSIKGLDPLCKIGVN